MPGILAPWPAYTGTGMGQVPSLTYHRTGSLHLFHDLPAGISIHSEEHDLLSRGDMHGNARHCRHFAKRSYGFRLEIAVWNFHCHGHGSVFLRIQPWC